MLEDYDLNNIRHYSTALSDSTMLTFLSLKCIIKLTMAANTSERIAANTKLRGSILRPNITTSTSATVTT